MLNQFLQILLKSMEVLMIRFLILILLVSPFTFSNESEKDISHTDFMECYSDNANNLIDCIDTYEINDLDACKQQLEPYSSAIEDLDSYCWDISMTYDLSLYMQDRPTDFFDLLARDSTGSPTRSYGCTVTYDDEGYAEPNTTIFEYIGEEMETSKEQRVAQVAIVHIDENLGYAEVNYGSTIYPVSEQRFFTNELRTKTLKWMGLVSNEIESEHKGGTDKGPYGGGWVIDEKENSLSIFAGNYEIVFTDNCSWNDVGKLIDE